MIKPVSYRSLSIGVLSLVVAAVAAGCGGDSSSKSTAAPTESSTTTQSTASESKTTTNERDGESSSAASSPTPSEGSAADTADAVFEATLKDGKVTGGPAIWRVKKGQSVAITVTSDISDELHLHGYDVSKDVAAGGTATLDVVADTSGSFELELENGGTLIGNLEVR